MSSSAATDTSLKHFHGPSPNALKALDIRHWLLAVTFLGVTSQGKATFCTSGDGWHVSSLKDNIRTSEHVREHILHGVPTLQICISHVIQ